MEKTSDKGKPVFGVGALEARILGVVYDVGATDGITVREVYEVLLKERKIAYTTAMTVMTNLMNKGLLSVDTSNVAFVYFPVFTREELRDQLIDDVVRTLYSGNREYYLSKV